MATTFQIKRSSVTGKVPNTTTLSIGELGLNLTDQKLFSSNGTGVFELGANLTNQTVNTQLTVGNSSVNAQINSSVLSIGTGTYTSSVNVGSNVYLNTSSLFIGNSTINSYHNSSSISFNASGGSISANGSGVLINVSSSDTALKVTQRGAGNSFIVEDVENDNTLFAIDSVGRLVVNFSTPYAMNNLAHPLTSFHGNTSTIRPEFHHYGWGVRSAIFSFFSENTTIGDKDTVPTLPADNRTLADWVTYVHTGTNNAIATAMIRTSVDDPSVAANTTKVPTNISFFTQNATSTTLGIRAYLAANGNFGIGTIDPTQTLHVSGNSLVTGTMLVGSNVTVNTSAFFVGNSSVNAQINSSVLSVGTGTYTSSVNVGSNVYLNTSSLFIGNSSINTVVNTDHLVISNSTSKVSANLSGVIVNVSSTDAALRVVQRGTGDAIVVEDVANDVTRFSVDQFGRTTIGHTGQIVIPNSSGSHSFSIHANSGSGINPYIGIYGWGTHPALQTFFSNNTTIGDKDTVPDLSASGRVISDWSSYVHTGANTAVLASRFRMVVDGTANTTTVPTAFTFLQQNATSTTLDSRHWWAANGNYGVGTSSPTERLHVSGNSLVTGTMLVGSNVTVNTSALFIGNTTQNVIVDQNSISFGTQTLISNTTGTLINVSSTGTALRVVQRSTGDAFRVDDADGDTTPFVIDSVGRVIQGHTAGVLTGANYYQQLHGNGTSTAGKTLFGWNAIPSINFTYSTNPEVANGAAPTLPTGNYAYPLRVRAHTDTDTYTEGLRFTVSVDGTANSTTVPTAFSIQQQNATSTTLSTRHFWAANGNYGVGTISPGSTLTVNGSLSKSSGSFNIPHPLPELSETHNLVHSFVEAPTADNIYRGKVQLENGQATVNIDTHVGMTEGTFSALNGNIQVFLQNDSGWDLVRGSVSSNILTIISYNQSSTDTISWMVIGERQDQHMLDTQWTDEFGRPILEPLKEPDPEISILEVSNENG